MMSTPRRRTHPHRMVPALLCIGLLSGLCGCVPLSVFAAKALPEPKVPPKYTNFQNQTLAVMVWADDGTQIDYPGIQLEVATAIQNKLQQVLSNPKHPGSKAFTGASFRWPAASVVRYQQDHPEIEGQPIAEIAPRLQVGRLIYIELENFQTRSDASVELYRGSMSGTLKMIEIAPDGTARTGYEEAGVTAVFPKNAPEEGMPNIGDRKIYQGLLDRFSTEVVNRFVPHVEEQ